MPGVGYGAYGHSSGGALQVTGVKEVRAALKELGEPEKRKEFRRAYIKVSEVAANLIRAAVPTGPARGGHAKTRIKPRATMSAAAVVILRRTVPYYGWLDFGSRNPNVGQPRSVGPWRQSGRGPADGRYAYPTIQRRRPQLVRELDHALDEAVRNLNLS